MNEQRSQKLAKRRLWYRSNPERERERSRRWRTEHAEHKRVKSTESKEKDARRAKQWALRHPDRMMEFSARRYARKKQRVPLWLSDEQRTQIRRFYELAHKLTELHGVKYHVDHIVPLCGKGVCGLHVPWNLQVLTAHENQRKMIAYDGQSSSLRKTAD